jgi:sensor domain CHASE-containing protein
MAGRIAPVSLQQKMSLMLLAVMAVMVLVSWLILQATVMPAFTRLERSVAETDMVRVQRAIRSDLDKLAATIGDWSPWDDAWSYVRGENPGFVRSNLDLATLANLDLDLLVVYDTERRMTWGALIEGSTLSPPERLGILDPGTSTFERLVSHAELDSRIDGLLATKEGPMLVSSRPIITSAKTGPIAGTMIMGQFFDEARVESLRQRTEVELDVFAPAAAPPVPGLSAGEPGAIVQVTDGGFVRAYSVLRDLAGDPLLVLEASTPRNVSATGGRAVKGAVLSLAAAGIVVAAATWLLLRIIILNPLGKLASHIGSIRQSGDLSVSLKLHGNDEIGALGREFDRMTSELNDARRALLEQSFKAGKADTAAEVLHNIRNALTPMINGIDRVSRTFQSSTGMRIAQATEELEDPACPPERRGKLLAYIRSAFEHLETARAGALEDLNVAARQGRQVEAILADQERHAKVPPVLESLALDEIVDEARLVLPDSGASAVTLNVDDGLGRYRVRAHRVGLAQVLGNIILNAYEAIQRTGNGNGTIHVCAAPEQQESRRMVRVTVRDSGCGFDEAAGRRIFQRGFTSKQPSEFAGLGLHWCANSVAAMGGRILAESTGPGQGAAFHVLLPAA